jgi:endoglucanase
MQLVRGGCASSVVSVPLRYMHTPIEVLDLRDLEAAAKLLATFCTDLKPNVDFIPS